MLPASDRNRDERLRRNLFALRDGHQRQSARFRNIHLIKFYLNFHERFSYFDVNFEPWKSGLPVPGQCNIRRYNSSHCIWRLAGKIYNQVDWWKAPFKITKYFWPWSSDKVAESELVGGRVRKRNFQTAQNVPKIHIRLLRVCLKVCS